MAQALVELVWWFLTGLVRSPSTPRARGAHYGAVVAVGMALAALVLMYIYNEQRAVFLVLALGCILAAGVAEFRADQADRKAHGVPPSSGAKNSAAG